MFTDLVTWFRPYGLAVVYVSSASICGLLALVSGSADAPWAANPTPLGVLSWCWSWVTGAQPAWVDAGAGWFSAREDALVPACALLTIAAVALLPRARGAYTNAHGASTAVLAGAVAVQAGAGLAVVGAWLGLGALAAGLLAGGSLRDRLGDALTSLVEVVMVPSMVPVVVGTWLLGGSRRRPATTCTGGQDAPAPVTLPTGAVARPSPARPRPGLR
ncbi:hypothetical protein [Thalassiella azotivora]